MSIETPTVGELFRIVTEKSMTTSPSTTWETTYALQATADTVYDTLIDFSLAAAEMEAALSGLDVHFFNARISTLLRDSSPYDPGTFVDQPFNFEGTRSGLGGETGEPLETCLFIERSLITGRQGKLMLRRCLKDSDVITTAGEAALASTSGMQTLLDAAVAASNMDDYLGAPAPGNAQLVVVSFHKITHAVTFVRPVIGLNVRGAANVKLKHKFFNRA
jgi:hypothetical protein